MKKKKWIEHNGNGQITINTWLAVCSIMILLLSSVLSVVILGVNAQNDIQHNNENIIEHESEIDYQGDEIDSHEKRLTTIETHLFHISETLDRIEDKIR